MSLIDELASADVDLDDLKISDLGVDISDLGWQQTEEGMVGEVQLQYDKYSMNFEEAEWLDRVLDSTRRIHATGVVRVYTAKAGETQWTYRGLFGAAAIVTEADLRMACAHFIRVIDLDGFNPNSSIILQQELYSGFKYTELSPFFHTFEMTKYIVGLSFANESHAKIFYEKVQECIQRSASDVVDDDLDSKEKTYKMVGDVGWRKADDAITVKLAKKYAGGGITDGIEVSWKKKTDDLPPELRNLLSQAGALTEPTPPKEAPAALSPRDIEARRRGLTNNSQSHAVIDLMKDPATRRATLLESNKTKTIGDGINLQWAKNTRALTDDTNNPPLQPEPVAADKDGKKQRRWLPTRKKKK